jgi:hypothetical protein
MLNFEQQKNNTKLQLLISFIIIWRSNINIILLINNTKLQLLWKIFQKKKKFINENKNIFLSNKTLTIDQNKIKKLKHTIFFKKNIWTSILVKINFNYY